MSISDEEMLNDEGDKKLQELWAKKERRRSSELKILVEDHLNLRDSTKLTVHLSKYGKWFVIPGAGSCLFWRLARSNARLRSLIS